MPSHTGRIAHPIRGTLANDALDTRVLNELRRPAPMRRDCPHGHGHSFCCSLCIRTYEDEQGWFAPRY